MKRYLNLILCLPWLLMAEQQVIDLQELGKVIYNFEDELCDKIIRLSPSGEVKYEHHYHYDKEKRLIGENLIGGLGEVEYSGSNEGGYLLAHTPFGDQLWSKNDSCDFEESNIEKVYDEEGQLIQKGSDRFFYKDNKLVSVITDETEVYFSYDKEGRRVSKKTISTDGESEEFYLFLGENEIGSISQDGELKWLRIPGVTPHSDMVRAIAIETGDTTYAPIYDQRWNIVKLVNIEDGSVLATRPDPFGQNLSRLNGCPWTFCSKRYEPEIGLVNFGARDYDPELREWTSLDPLEQDNDPYRYCFNNPMQYIDPDGRAAIAFAVPLVQIVGGVVSFPVLGGAALVTLAGAGCYYGGKALYNKYQAREHQKSLLEHDDPLEYQKWTEQSESGTINKMYNTPNAYFYEKTLESLDNEKKQGSSFPERELPRDTFTEEPLPDCDKPHSQLGTKQGSKGDYSQAREFDQNGKPVKDIDFTDHGRPNSHPNPHVHEYKENETGGTRQRGPATALEGEEK